MRKPLLPKVSVTKQQSADITELPESPLKPGYFRTKSNLRTPGGFLRSPSKTLFDETRFKDSYNQFCDRVSETSTSMLNNLQDLSNHVDGIGRPFEKYYEKSSLKRRKEIRSILDINYDFYKNESTQKSSYDVTSPKFFIFTSIPQSPKRRPQLPTSPKKYHGIHLLDTPITLHPSRQFKNVNTLKHAETRAKLQLKIDTKLDRKESTLSNLNISIQSPVLLTSTLDSPTKPNESNQKLPVSLVSKNNSRSIQHANRTDLRNNSNVSLQFSIRRRKQLMEEIVAKDSLNVEKIETIMQQSDVSSAIDSSTTYKNTNSASKSNIQKTKTRVLGHNKQSDSIGCQILALDGAQRRKIKERLKSVLPNNTTFDKFFTNA